MFTALLVGIGAGLGAVAFRWLIEAAQLVFYGGLGSLIEFNPLKLLIIPALGGLLTGPIVYRFAREAKGHGVPEVMEAVAIRGGRIRPQVGLVKAVASALLIGSGGSVGSEGPIVQIGSALGSSIGQVLRLSDERVRNLVACGAAGGIAAVFNAPIGGAIFAMEVILGRVHTVYFGAVVISSVTASIISRVLTGNESVFRVPGYSLVNPWELLLYVALGLIAAPAAVGFSRLLYLAEDVFDGLRFPEYLKPTLGGLMLGLVGLISFKTDGIPAIFGVGYETIGETLSGNLPLILVFSLLILKLLGTIFTLGSGGSGGIFAPSLFMGAMLGSSFGQVVNNLFPAITAPSGAYALVGMAAFFSGATHAPMTAILILFEMTNDYRIILPLMLATVISTLISRIISRDSIYTLKLSRKGVHLQEGTDIDVMQAVTVGEVMNTHFDTIPADMPLIDLQTLFQTTHSHGFPVVDSQGNLVGIISISDLDRALQDGELEGKTVADIATTRGLLLTYPDEPMWTALNRLGARDVSRLPVVERSNPKHIVGIIRRADIVRAYNHAIAKRAKQQYRLDLVRMGRLDDARFVQIEIPSDSPVNGQRIRDVSLPDDCLIVSVRKGRKLHIADGYTVLQPGDRVTALARQDCSLQLKAALIGQDQIQLSAEDHLTARYGEIHLDAASKAVGKMVKELDLPAEAVLVSIRREKETLIPHGDTVLNAGDDVEIFGYTSQWEKVENALGSPGVRDG
jgi:CIC family chloride channel protein